MGLGLHPRDFIWLQATSFSCSIPVLSLSSLPHKFWHKFLRRISYLPLLFVTEVHFKSFYSSPPWSDFSNSHLKVSIVKLPTLKPASTAATTVVMNKVQLKVYPFWQLAKRQITACNQVDYISLPYSPLWSVFNPIACMEISSSLSSLEFFYSRGFPSYDTLLQTIWSGWWWFGALVVSDSWRLYGL